MRNKSSGSIEALVPRGRVGFSENILDAKVTTDGLCPLKISWENGSISGVEVVSTSKDSSLRLLLPRLVEPHTHLDKAFSWNKAPNLKGTYFAALDANIGELKSRTIDDVLERTERSLNQSLSNGVRAIRTHIDSLGEENSKCWEALLDLKLQWQSLIELQLVALVPLEHWSTFEGESFALQVAGAGGRIGGVFVPPFEGRRSIDLLRKTLTLANTLGCGLDLHIDESQVSPGSGLKLLMNLLDGMDIRVVITCSHSSSMGLLPDSALRRLANRIANHGVNVIALPLTNSWLLGRKPYATPMKRPLAPISQLQQEGVTVAVGGDNVQDCWFPGGNFDPLALMAFSLPIAQLAPWQRIGLAPFTTSAAAVMELDWDGIIEVGSPADLMLLEASNWSEALAAPPSRRILVRGIWLDEITIDKKYSKPNLST